MRTHVRIFWAAGKRNKKTGKVGPRRAGCDWEDLTTGERHRKIVGTKAQAQRVAAQIAANNFEWKHFGRRVLTLEGLRDLQLARAAEKRSLADDEQRWETILEIVGADRVVETLLPSDVTRLREALLERDSPRGGKMKPATVNRHLALLRSAMNIAIAERAAKSNPVARGMLLDEANERTRIVSPTEYRRLLLTASTELRLAIELAYETGMRQAEIASIDPKNIDEVARTVRVERAKRDRGRRRGRVVPIISSRAMTLLAAAKAASAGRERIFEIKSNWISHGFRKLTKRLKIAGLTFHDLRHSAATRMAKDGVDPYRLQVIFDWATLDMAVRYVNLAQSDFSVSK